MDIQYIKCVIWDLDNTLWKGILLEDSSVTVNKKVLNTIVELDKRGILNSIASRNNYDDAWKKLEELGISKYFVFPEINMGNKSDSILRISSNLNLSLDSFAFIDDQDYELAEVLSVCPEVLCIKMDEKFSILDRQEFIPRFITSDSHKRRELYQNEIKRNLYKQSRCKNELAFLQSLNLKIGIKRATVDDLKRIEELTIRTHQMNSTGITYSYEDLCKMIENPQYIVLITEMSDSFGEYGKIGVTLIEVKESKYIIKLHLMSCRVISRGVGNIVLIDVMKRIQNSDISLYADYQKTERNKNMYLAYKLIGFREKRTNGSYVLFEYDKSIIHDYPSYVVVVSDW